MPSSFTLFKSPANTKNQTHCGFCFILLDEHIAQPVRVFHESISHSMVVLVQLPFLEKMFDLTFLLVECCIKHITMKNNDLMFYKLLFVFGLGSLQLLLGNN